MGLVDRMPPRKKKVENSVAAAAAGGGGGAGEVAEVEGGGPAPAAAAGGGPDPGVAPPIQFPIRGPKAEAAIQAAVAKVPELVKEKGSSYITNYMRGVLSILWNKTSIALKKLVTTQELSIFDYVKNIENGTITNLIYTPSPTLDMLRTVKGTETIIAIDEISGKTLTASERDLIMAYSLLQECNRLYTEQTTRSSVGPAISAAAAANLAAAEANYIESVFMFACALHIYGKARAITSDAAIKLLGVPRQPSLTETPAGEVIYHFSARDMTNIIAVFNECDEKLKAEYTPLLSTDKNTLTIKKEADALRKWSSLLSLRFRINPASVAEAQKLIDLIAPGLRAAAEPTMSAAAAKPGIEYLSGPLPGANMPPGGFLTKEQKALERVIAAPTGAPFSTFGMGAAVAGAASAAASGAVKAVAAEAAARYENLGEGVSSALASMAPAAAGGGGGGAPMIQEGGPSIGPGSKRGRGTTTNTNAPTQQRTRGGGRRQTRRKGSKLRRSTRRHRRNHPRAKMTRRRR